MGNRYESRLLVVKIGTDTLVRDGVFDEEYAGSVAEQIAAIRSDGTETILKSSGAIALGGAALGAEAPREKKSQVGQELLSIGWEKAFRGVRLNTHQVLYVPGGLREADQQVTEALDRGQVPISNGDDTAAADHPDAYTVQNNDLLAARTAIKHGANLVNLTKPEGVLDGHGRVIPIVTDLTEVTIFDGKTQNGTGGMRTKIEAGLIVARSGRQSAIAGGRQPDVIRKFAKGEHVGTALRQRPNR